MKLSGRTSSLELFRIRRFWGIYNGCLRAFGTPEEYGAVKKFIKFEGLNRQWYEYVPTSVKNNPDKKAPLVVASHGGHGTGREYMFESDWFKLAESRGFIVVFPSIGNIKYLTDLPNLTREMVNNIKANYNIDNSRVYAAGFSGGGQASLIYALTLPDVFTAARANSGLPAPNYPSVEDFLSKFKVRTDYQIPYMFIYGTKQSWEVQCDPKLPDLMNYWINRYKTSKFSEPKTFSSGTYRHRLYYNQEGVPMVRLTSIENMPHTTLPEEP